MAMSRRKQLHPKSLKEGDETISLLPDELKYDEESHDIVARTDIEQGFRFGPFPAVEVPCQSQQQVSFDSDATNGGGDGGAASVIAQIDQATVEHRTESLQLLDQKHNWLARCSLVVNGVLLSNLNVVHEDDHVVAIVSQPIAAGARLCSNLSILPKVSPTDDVPMKQEAKSNSTSTPPCTDDVRVKQEPIESEEEQQTDFSIPTVKAEPPLSMIDSPKSKETKKLHPLLFTCDDCGIRYSNRSTLDAHRQHYCTKRETLPAPITTTMTTTTTTTKTTTKSHSTDSTAAVKIKSMKRKHLDRTDASPSPTKRLSLSLNETYCSECDILFSKSDIYLQHKLHYCGTKSSSQRSVNEQNLSKSFRAPVPFDRPIQIGQFIYVPVPIVPTQMDHSPSSSSPSSSPTPPSLYEPDHNNNHYNKPLDLSRPKKVNDDDDAQHRPKPSSSSAAPLDLSVEKSTSLFNLLNTAAKGAHLAQQQIHECDYCSIRFSSLKTLHAHQDSYCIEYRKQKKAGSTHLSTTNEMKSANNDANRSQSPSSAISKSTVVPSNESTVLSPLPPHRSSPFMCRLCKYRGNTLRGMRMHFKFHLSNNEPCSDDDIIMTSTINHVSPLATPTLSTCQLLLKCTICSAMFDQEDALLNHIKCVHTKESLLECKECQSRFCSKWNLLRHMKLTHTNIKCDEEEQQGDHEEEQIPSNESHGTVDESSKSSERIDDDRDLPSPPNDKASDPMNLTRHVLIESMDTNSSKKIASGLSMKKKFACPYCHIKFGSVDTLKQHMSNYCVSRPTNEEVPLNHKKRTITSANETYCSTCQIPFRHKNSYEAHKMYYCRGSNKAHVKMQA